MPCGRCCHKGNSIARFFAFWCNHPPLLRMLISTSSILFRCGIVTLSGLAYAAAFPPLGWRWLIIPGITGLLWALQGQRGSQARAIGFLHGMVTYTAALPWLWLIFGPFA